MSGTGPVYVASASGDSIDAIVGTLARQLPRRGLAALMVFVSPAYDPGALAEAFVRHFGSLPVYGCTTAGELTPSGITDDHVVAMGFDADSFHIVAQPIIEVDQVSFETMRACVRDMRTRFFLEGHDLDSARQFAVLLVDGLCRHEEILVSTIRACLDDIDIVGGSAGDGLKYRNTWVIFDGKARRNAAVLLIFSTRLPFRLFKCNSFVPTTIKLVVTRADVSQRIVYELNAEPAALEYSRIAGVSYGELNDTCFAANPMIVRIGGDYYVRSIQQANDNGSLTFFCAIDEGLVLTAAARLDTLDTVEEMFRATEAEIGEVAVYLGFDCIHRRLDAEQRQIIRDLSDLYRRNRVVGFNTYGEQYGSMHLNQTFSGVAIGRKGASP